ncbi:MAG: hypothetical protein ABJF04_05520 [Reichenbachiella sp.]|uniref:hypothetical protein n=1 Tax=Reichenbachiella sp. TaxID=2184521 RepID=UPI003263D44A
MWKILLRSLFDYPDFNSEIKTISRTVTFNPVINKISSNPRNLLLIDGIGALLSAFLLGVILTRFESTFGMPKKTLYILAFLPCIIVLYDLSCYFGLSKNWIPYLKTIAIANLIYACISLGMVLHHYQQLTALGLTYFLLELVIVVALASIELKVAATLTSGRT